MTKKEWLELYDKNSPEFEWFIRAMFMGNTYLDLLAGFRKRDDNVGLMSTLNRIWYVLPDNKFNIIENPKGWAQFLELLENPPE
jgi:hypothetical protein